MRFHYGAIPENDFEPDDSWRSIREPGPLLMQLYAVPIAIALLVFFTFAWARAATIGQLEILQTHPIIFGISAILSFPLLIIVHELLHAVAHPGCGRHPGTIIGAWPEKILFYAHYCGELTRNRFLIVFAMPFLVISVLPLVIAMTGIFSPSVAAVAAWFSIWNALFACGDVFGFLLMLCQIPANSYVRNKGWYTYWKPINE